MNDQKHSREPENPFAAGHTAVDDDLLSSWEVTKALVSGLTTGALTVVLGISALWVIVEFFLHAYGITDPAKPVPEQLSPGILAGLSAGVLIVLLVAAKLGSHARDSAANAYKRIAAVERKRTLLGEQAASLKKALKEQREQADR